MLNGILKRLDTLERTSTPPGLPSTVVIRKAKDGDGYTAHEVYISATGAQSVKEIHLTHFEDYIRPKGCTCPCIYLVRRKVLPTNHEHIEQLKENGFVLQGADLADENSTFSRDS